MDKKLLLAIQYSCNSAGLAVPWTNIGNIMGDEITGGAVIQHLAKLRIRMVAAGLPVPPPLRRGGGSSRLSTSASSSSKAKGAPNKDGNAQAAPNKNNSTPAKPKKTGKRAAAGSDESEDEGDFWKNDDSDAEYGQPRAKRAKFNARGPMQRKIKAEDSDEEDATPLKAPKRKHQSSKSSSRDLSAYGETDINGVPIDYGSDVEDDTNAELVAAGAPFLALEDDYASHPEIGKKTPYKKKSLIVSLPSTVGAIKEEDNGDVSDDESEDEVVGGGIDGSHVLSDEEMEQEFFSSPYNQNFAELAAAQVEPASHSTMHNNMYNNLHHANPQLNAFNGGLNQNRQAFADAYSNGLNNPFAFQAYDGMFENDGSVQNQITEQSGGFESHIGGSFDLGHISATSNDQSAGGFGEYVDGLNGSFELDTPPFFHGIGHSQAVPYNIQTSWPGNSAGPSNESSVNQTPADTSAGVDYCTGYFRNGHFDLGTLHNTEIEFPLDDGTNGLFDAGQLDGNSFGNGVYGGDSYGN